MSVGSISGNLLSPNLLRDGRNLAFETKLLFLDVANGRVGINTSTPVRDLTINSYTLTDNLIVDNLVSFQNITFSSNNIDDLVSSIYITPNQSSNPQIIGTGFATSGITISDTTITGSMNGNVVIQPDATGQINFNTAQVTVYGDLHVTGFITDDGNTTIGNQAGDTVNFVAEINSDILPSTTGNYSLGTPDLRWQHLYSTGANIGNTIQISGNTISTLSGNTDLIITVDDSKIVSFPSATFSIDNNLTLSTIPIINGEFDITGLLTVNGNIYRTGTTHLTGTVNQTGSVDLTGSMYITGLITSQTSLFSTGNFSINSNNVTATNLNGGINLTSSRYVSFYNTLEFANDQISNILTGPSYTDLQKSIEFTTGTGKFIINSTGSLQIPYGNDSNYALSLVGQIRENSTTQLYEGWQPNGSVSFNQIYSSNRLTYITPELTPGLSDHIIRFGVNGTVSALLDTTKLSIVTEFNGGNVVVGSSGIDNRISDVSFSPLGTGSTIINGISFSQNTITNTTNSALTFVSTDSGYVKFSGSFGVVFPVGDSTNRPSTPEVGTIRFNTSIDAEEVWTGSAWVLLSNQLSVSDVSTVMDIWTIILG